MATARQYLAIIAAITLLAPLQTAYAFEVDAEARVTRVVDGDTIRVIIVSDNPGPPDLKEGREYRVRLADINAPELDTPEGMEAKIALSKLITAGDTVLLDVDDIEVYDRYGRLVAVVYIETPRGILNINKWLVDNGYAEIWDHRNEFNPAEWNLYETNAQMEPDKKESPTTTPGINIILLAAAIAGIILASAAIARTLLKRG